MKLPFKIDLSGKIIAVTGAGGVLMSEFAEALALCGAKVALLDININAAEKAAERITQEGGSAVAIRTDCLDKNSIINAKNIICNKFGRVNFLINGAGGNNPAGTTDNETMAEVKEGILLTII